MNLLKRISEKFNSGVAVIKPTKFRTTSVTVRNNRVKVTSPQLLQISEATELLFGKRHWYLWDGNISAIGYTWDWFLPELLFMLETLLERKMANPVYGTQLLVDAIRLDTWVGRARAHERIDYKKIYNALKWRPLPHQREYMDHYEYSTSKYELKGGLAAMAAGSGKALADNEPVLTPKGWVPISTLRVGDWVIGSSGRPVEVTGVYPQGVRDLYRMDFKDGSYSVCDGDHLWPVNGTVLSTTDMRLAGVTTANNHSVYTLPLFSGVICSASSDLNYDPLTFGKMMRGTQYSKAELPEEYLRGSASQRADLYEGITGETYYANHLYFKTRSRKLADDVADLARGLGKYVYVGVVPGMDFHNTYVVKELEHPSKDIIRITPVAEGNATCISVDATDSLYVTRGHTLTHNTYTSIAIAEGLEMERIIVLCPKPVIYDPWVVSTEELYKRPQRNVWSVMDKRSPHPNDKYLICNYAYMDKLFDQLRYFKKKRTMIIADESHNLNELTAAQTRSYIRLATTHGDEIIHLSGTPLKARIDELIPIMSVIDPRFTEEVAKRFARLFTHNKSPDVLALIHNRMNRMSHSVEKAALKLKEPIVKSHVVKIRGGEKYTIENVKKAMIKYSEKQLKIHLKNRPAAIATYWKLVDSLEHDVKLYAAHKRDFKVLVANTSYFHIREEMRNVNEYERVNVIPRLNNADRKLFRSIRAVAKYPKLKTLGQTLGNVLGKMRIQCNVDIAKSLNYSKVFGTAKGKCLFFSNHVAAINAMAVGSKKHGYAPLVMYGEHVDDLPEIIKTFRDTGANPLGATFASLSTGVPLTMVSDVYVLDSPFRDYVLNQAISRAYRLGNDYQVYVHYILLKTKTPNINDRSLELAEWSSDTVSEILDIEPSVEYPKGVQEEIVE